MRRVISVWSPDWPITVWLRPGRNGARQPPPEGAPFALTDRGARGVTLHALNAAARAAGLYRGQSHADACAILPALISAPAEPERDLAMLKRLALWAEWFSPSVAVDARVAGQEGLLLDMTGGAHLFGGEAALLAEIRARLAAAGVPARLAIADTPAAAWALARFTASEDVIAPAGKTREAIAGLPVEGLRLEPEALVLLKRFGLKRIGDLYGLPRASLARRFRGPEGLRVVERLDQALGVLGEALTPERPPPAYRVWSPFAEPLIDMAGVDFHLPRLMRALCAQLVQAGQGARRLSLIGYRVDGRTTAIEAGLSAPSASPAHLVRLLREKGLEHLDLGFGIDAMMLAVGKAEIVEVRQNTLAPPFAGRGQGEGSRRRFLPLQIDHVTRIDPSSCPLPTSWGEGSADLAALIDRLQAKLGEGAVLRPAPRESWIPERSEAWTPARPDEAPTDFDLGRDRPILLLERPEEVTTLAQAPDGAPRQFTWRRVQHQVVKAEGPERLSPEWWRQPPGAPRPARTRDYYRLEDEQGHRYWLFREGLYDREDIEIDEETRVERPRLPTWWMHGVFA
jgi:protein ImuB